MIFEDEVREGSGTIFVTREMQQQHENEDFSPLDMSHNASVTLREHVISLRDNIVTPFEYNGGGDTEEEQASTAQYFAFDRSCLSQQFQNMSCKFESSDIEIERLTPLLISHEPRRYERTWELLMHLNYFIAGLSLISPIGLFMFLFSTMVELSLVWYRHKAEIPSLYGQKISFFKGNAKTDLAMVTMNVVVLLLMIFFTLTRMIEYEYFFSFMAFFGCLLLSMTTLYQMTTQPERRLHMICRLTGLFFVSRGTTMDTWTLLFIIGPLFDIGFWFQKPSDEIFEGENNCCICIRSLCQVWKYMKYQNNEEKSSTSFLQSFKKQSNSSKIKFWKQLQFLLSAFAFIASPMAADTSKLLFGCYMFLIGTLLDVYIVCSSMGREEEEQRALRNKRLSAVLNTLACILLFWINERNVIFLFGCILLDLSSIFTITFDRKSKPSMICRSCGCFFLILYYGNKGDIHIFTSGFFFMFSALIDMIILMREILHADEAEEPSGLELADFVESITRRNINTL